MLTERQIKALDWILTCQIEQTAERAPGMQPDQAVEEICDISSIVDLLPPGEVHSRLMPQCEEIRREHQVRLDQVLAEEAGASQTQLELLSKYISKDDIVFDKKTFLRVVADRINDDIEALSSENSSKPKPGVAVENSPLWTAEQRRLSVGNHMDYYGKTLGWKDD